MKPLPAVACLLLFALTAGCFQASISREYLESQLPRADGSILQVKCDSNIQHAISSISATLSGTPQVTIVKDSRTFMVTATQITLNEKVYASIPSDASKVRIAIDAERIAVFIDGEPVPPAD